MKNYILNFLKRPIPKKTIISNGGFKYQDDTIFCFSSEGSKWGVMKMNDSMVYEELLPPIYDSTGYDANNNLIIAVNYPKGKYTGAENSYYLFETDGFQVAVFENIDHLLFEKNGNILIVENKKYGLLNEKFQFDIPCEYALLTSLSNDFFAFGKLNPDDPESDKTAYEKANGIITRKNEIITSFDMTLQAFAPVYLDTVIIGTNDSFLIEKEYYCFNVISKEKKILPFEKIYDTQPYHYHYNSQAFFRTVTEIAPDDIDFKMDTFDTDQYVPGKWGVIFPNGAIAIPNQFEYIERISATHFKFGVGSPVIEEDFVNAIQYLKNIKWGVIDSKNNEILAAEFDWIDFNEAQGVLITNKGGSVFWNKLDHSPEWEIDGGLIEEFKLI